MYTEINFKTKKAFKEAIASGQKIRIYQPGGIFSPHEAEPNYSGKAYIEGPHYPEPHRWYAEAEMKDGVIVKVE
jgi:hypothetical protein